MAAGSTFISQSFLDSETVLLRVIFHLTRGNNEEPFIYVFNPSSFRYSYWSSMMILNPEANGGEYPQMEE